ncbi:threonine dehydratase [Pseudonocardia sediminis]|uniref:Threonine dehydratase n=1 Tax=Pseudonocardia sediminis TaxID=1397368 RepID=A0A4Q7UVR1_PSEST|nr:pyridoxal-phosphate dependent enzyme [Pseudonocardia sediminis]RZT85038.1 threonine dehydratase [Pseudonocardia sediminis]
MDLDLARIDQAHRIIDPVFSDTPQYEDPQLRDAVGRRVLVKVETLNPIRSFKGRGVDFALHSAEPGSTVVCSSSGNFGQAVAYVGRSRGLHVRVYSPPTVNEAKRARMEAFGATVVTTGPEASAPRDASREFAASTPGAVLLEDGREPAIAEGAGTIGVELLRSGPVDAVVLPIGDGSLITGVALWVRHHAPGTRIVGVNPSTAPSMHDSVRAGHPVTAVPTSTFPEGIDIPTPHAESVDRVRELVDEIVLVDEGAMRSAMGLIARHLGVLPEPAGAAGLAAIAGGGIDGSRVATVVTGANPSPTTLAALAAGLADDAR